MSKEAAIDVLRNAVKTLKLLGQETDRSKTDAYNDVINGWRTLMEAYAMALDDSTKAHASLGFDKAHKIFFGLTQDTNRSKYSDYVWVASAGFALAGAMKWLYFDKPTV